MFFLNDLLVVFTNFGMAGAECRAGHIFIQKHQSFLSQCAIQFSPWLKLVIPKYLHSGIFLHLPNLILPEKSLKEN